MTRDSTVTIESASPPYVECIHWLPRKLALGGAAGTMADVVIDQHALQEMRSHARGDVDVSVGGLLIGHVFQDPTCSRTWALVESTVPAAAPLSDDPSSAELRRSLTSLPVPAGGVAVGWYRTHPRTGLYLSEAEAEYHRTSFPDVWQCAVVLLGEDERTAGGVFQRTDRGLSRSTYAPFYERVDPSSQLAGRTCRTFSAWTSYETQASVAPAGQDGVSAELPPPERRSAPTAPSPLEPHGTDATPGAAPGAESTPHTTPPRESAAERGTGPSPAGAGAKDRREANGSDEAWSKLQIQRSLTAVGRTLTPSALGELGAPASVVDPARLEEDGPDERRALADGPRVDTPPSAPGAPPETQVGPIPVAPALGVRPEPPVHEREEAPPVPPPPPDPSRAPDGELAAARALREAEAAGLSGQPTALPAESAGLLVGRSRRRPRRPPRTIAFAVAALFVMAAGIWVGVQIAGPAPGAIDGDPDRTDLAPAGVGINDRPFFGERSGDADAPNDPAAPADPDARADADPGGPGPEGERTGDPFGQAVFGVEGAAGADAGGRSVVEPGGAEAPSEAQEAAGPSPTAPRPVAAAAGPPDPLPLVIDDPVVAAYEDALQIFGKEADRYDEVRRSFDDGLQGCNPLNLAYRAVRDSFARLSERFEQARTYFAGPGLRAFESAEREAAVIQRHYELTDCPPPIGG